MPEFCMQLKWKFTEYFWHFYFLNDIMRHTKQGKGWFYFPTGHCHEDVISGAAAAIW